MADWKDVANVIANLAPTVGAGIGGPVGAGVGVAIKALAGVFGITSADPKPQEVLNAIQSDPQAVLKLEQARISFETEKIKDTTEKFRLALADVQDARRLGTMGVKDTNLYILAWSMVGGFFTLLTFLLFKPVPADQSGVIFMLFGALSTSFGAVISYFFGSSAGSAAKSKELENLLKAKNNP